MGCGGSKPATNDQPNPPANQNPPVRENPAQQQQQPVQPGSLGPEYDVFPSHQLLVKSQIEWHKLSLQPHPGSDDGLPGPFPPPTSKHDFLGSKDFTSIDKYASEAPDLQYFDNMESLASYLCSVEGDDLDRLRVFYMWTMSLNVRCLGLQNFPSIDSPGYFLLRVAIASAYLAEFFTELCKYANIPCRILSGKVKDHLYRPGEDVISDVHWCATYIQNSWRHVYFSLDAIYESDPTRKQPVSDYGFLIDPEKLIYKTLCTDAPWQLLGRPVEYQEFKEMAFLKEGYFTHKIRNISQTKCFSLADNGEIMYEFNTGTHLDLACTVTNLCSLVRIDQSHLNRSVTINNDNDVKTIRIQFPDAGKYNVKIMCKDAEFGNKEAIAEYVVVSQQPCFHAEPNYLPKDVPFGLNSWAREIGLTAASHTSGHITTDNGQVELKFNCNSNMFDDIFSELDRADKTVKNMNSFIAVYSLHNQLIFRINLPKRGYYVLKLFIRKPTSVKPKKAGQKTCIGAYVINALQAYPDWTPFPTKKIGYMSNSFSEYIENISIDNPYLVIDGHEYTFDIKAQNNKQLVAHIDHATEKAVTQLEKEYTLSELNDNNYKIHVRFPKAGIYSVQIFGETEENKTGLSVNVYTYLVIVSSVDSDCVPFPWPACEPINSLSLLEPKSGKLQPGVKTTFKLILGDASRVYLKDDLTETPLVQSELGSWSVQLDTGHKDNELTLWAVIDGRKMELYIFDVLSKKHWDRMKQYQQKNVDNATNRQKEKQDREKAEAEEKVEQDARNQEEINKKKVQFESRNQEYNQAEDRCRAEAEEDYRSRLEVYQQELADRRAKENLPRNQREQIMRDELEAQKKLADSEWMMLRRRYSGMMDSVLRDNLRDATRRRNSEDIEKAIHAFRGSGLRDQGDLTQARKVLSILQEQQKLREAMEHRDVDTIQECYNHIVRKGYQKQLQQDLIEADRLMDQLGRSGQTSSLPHLDKATMTEIRGYKQPPSVVHQVMQAVLLLLGEDEFTTFEWRSCQKLCVTYGKEGLLKKISVFHINTVHPEIIARVREILYDLSLYKVQSVCAGISGLYVWAVGVTDDAEPVVYDEEDTPVTPANVERQLEILGRPLPDRRRSSMAPMDPRRTSVASPARISMQVM